jgi:hypothetical protein
MYVDEMPMTRPAMIPTKAAAPNCEFGLVLNVTYWSNGRAHDSQTCIEAGVKQSVRAS